RNDMPPRDTAENPKFMLQRNGADISDIQKVSRAVVRSEVLLLHFKPHLRWIIVTLFRIIHRKDETLRLFVLRGHCGVKVRSKCRNAAFAGQVIAYERQFPDFSGCLHASLWLPRGKITSPSENCQWVLPCHSCLARGI